MKKVILFAAMLLALGGCRFKEEFYIDFTHVQGEPGMFRATYQRSTDLSQGMPADTWLPGGTSLNQYVAEEETKATNTMASSIIQNLLKLGNQKKLIEISGLYESVDETGKPVTLSGKLIIPANGEIKRVIIVSHYTIGMDAEAPSNCFPLEGQIASLGYALVVPDYIGYGVTNDRYHPYLMMDLTAHNVLDMYFSVLPFLDAIGRTPVNKEVYLMGFSQGGGNTMAVQRLLETQYGPSSKNYVPVKRVFAGGGIYDIKYTFENFVLTNVAAYPCGVPFVLVGQVKGYHLDDQILSDLLQPRIFEYVDDWFLYKMTPTGNMNKLIGTKQTDQILRPEGFVHLSTLYSVMTKNSVLSFAWSPKAPVYMMHSIDDDTVPYGNALRAKEKWQDSNIQYNFGHYGNHIMCCLRFIYTVKGMLKDEEE